MNIFYKITFIAFFSVSIVESKTTTIYTPRDMELISALLLKDSNSIETILQQDANPNIKYLNQKLVHYAVKTGDLKTALILVKNGVDFSGIVDDQQDIFTYISNNFSCSIPCSAKQPDFDLLYELIQKGYQYTNNFNNKNLVNNAWYSAIIRGKVNHIGLFLGWKGSKNNPYPLLHAADINQIFSFPDGSTTTPLLLSIKLIVEHAKQPNIGGGTFITLLRYKEIDVNKKARPNGNKLQSPLSYVLEINPTPHAYNWGIGYAIDNLIRNGANLAEAVAIFIKNNGSPNKIISDKTRRQEWTLLGLAVFYKDIEAVKTLLAAGADINQPTDHSVYSGLDGLELKGKHTPLYFALKNGAMDIAQLLIEKGAKV